MKIRIDYRQETALEIVPNWLRLLKQTSVASPFATPSWYLSWAAAARERATALRIVSVWDGTDLIAIAPFALRHDVIGGIPLRVLGLPAGGATPHVGIAAANCDEDLISMLVSGISSLAGWDVLSLESIYSGEPWLGAFMRSLERQMLSTRLSPTSSHPQLFLAASWSETEGGLRSSLRQNIRRRTKRLLEMGECRFERYRGTEIGRAQLKVAQDIESRSWKARSVGGVFKTEAGVDWHVRVASHAELAIPDLAILTLDDTPLAFQYGFLHEDLYYAYTTSYAEAQRGAAPGAVLFGHLMREFSDSGVSRVDLLTGEDGYKADWTDSAREMLKLLSYRRSTMGLLGSASQALIAQSRASWERLRSRPRRIQDSAPLPRQPFSP